VYPEIKYFNQQFFC